MGDATNQRRGPAAPAVLLLLLSLVLAACGASSTSTDAPSEADPTTASETDPTTEGTVESTGEQSESSDPIDLALGGAAASSAFHVFGNAHFREVRDHYPAINFTLRETGGGEDNLGLVTEGQVDVGLSSAESVAGWIEDGAPIRYIMTFAVSPTFALVRSETGIDNVEDLEGESFSPGRSGSSAADVFAALLKEGLGIQYDEFLGDNQDMVDAMKDGRIVGFAQTAASLQDYNAPQLDVAATLDVTPVGFTQEQVEELTDEFPAASFVEVTDLPDQEAPFFGHMVAVGWFVHEDADEDTVYRVTKALNETLGAAVEAQDFAAGRGVGPEETVLTQETALLHPGAERYYREVGAL